jgi:hypothetical protein
MPWKYSGEWMHKSTYSISALGLGDWLVSVSTFCISGKTAPEHNVCKVEWASEPALIWWSTENPIFCK